MTPAKRSVVFAVLAAVIAVFVCSGCTDDDPNIPEQEETGTIVIDQAPDALTGAGWSLSGPQDETGAGDTTLTGMPVGAYTLSWHAVSGYRTPSAESEDLGAEGTISFLGVYMSDDFVLIPAGNFMMGSPIDEDLRGSDETRHLVTLTTPFHMLATEVTNTQYAELAQWAYDNGYCTATSALVSDALDGSTEDLLDLEGYGAEISFSGGTFTVDAGKEDHPVQVVTWYGAAAYCDWLSLRDGLPRAYDHFSWMCNHHKPYSAPGYRLPTEAEWEYACRAGTQTPFNTGECLDAGSEANYNGNHPYAGCPEGPYVEWTTPVGSYPANAFGLFDMHGNMLEWCNDWYEEDYEGDVTDPVGPYTAVVRVCRGGVWFNPAQVARSAQRDVNVPFGNCGFRPVRSVTKR